jgi:AcrR family transcriptional regulator
VRALTEAERQERQDALADHALALFSEFGYAKLTMDALARRAGVAKGSVFLAFASKEDLFLYAARRRLEAWFTRLKTMEPGPTSRSWAQTILKSLRADTLLLPLLGLVGPVLEQACTPSAVVGLKESIARGMAGLAQTWSPRLPRLLPEDWGPLFLRVYALIVGAWAVGEASAAVREALEDRPDLAVFVTGFDDLFLPMLEALLTGIIDP